MRGETRWQSHPIPRPDYDSPWKEVLESRFPTVKLLDWRERWAELEASDNRFALVVMAQLAANCDGTGPEERKAVKLRLMRLMYDRGFHRSDILELFRIVDWMIRLPDSLEQAFLAEVHAIEEAMKMPYITSAERFAIQRGIEQGIEKGIEQGVAQGEAAVLLRLMRRKYGTEAVAAYRERIERADARTMLEWAERVLTADSSQSPLVRGILLRTIDDYPVWFRLRRVRCFNQVRTTI